MGFSFALPYMSSPGPGLGSGPGPGPVCLSAVAGTESSQGQFDPGERKGN